MDRHAVHRRRRRGGGQPAHPAPGTRRADHRGCRRRVGLRARHGGAAPRRQARQHHVGPRFGRSEGTGVPHRFRDRAAPRGLHPPHPDRHVHRHPRLRLPGTDDRRPPRPAHRPIRAGLRPVLAAGGRRPVRRRQPRRHHQGPPAPGPSAAGRSSPRPEPRPGRGPRGGHGQTPGIPLRHLRGFRRRRPPRTHHDVRSPPSPAPDALPGHAPIHAGRATAVGAARRDAAAGGSTRCPGRAVRIAGSATGPSRTSGSATRQARRSAPATGSPFRRGVATGGSASRDASRSGTRLRNATRRIRAVLCRPAGIARATARFTACSGPAAGTAFRCRTTAGGSASRSRDATGSASAATLPRSEFRGSAGRPPIALRCSTGAAGSAAASSAGSAVCSPGSARCAGIAAAAASTAEFAVRSPGSAGFASAGARSASVAGDRASFAGIAWTRARFRAVGGRARVVGVASRFVRCPGTRCGSGEAVGERRDRGERRCHRSVRGGGAGVAGRRVGGAGAGAGVRVAEVREASGFRGGGGVGQVRAVGVGICPGGRCRRRHHAE